MPSFGRGVDLEVAGHDNGADRRMDGKGDGVGNGVVHMDELHLEAAGLHVSPASWVVELSSCSERPCSSSLSLMRPAVRRVACTGALNCLQHIGHARRCGPRGRG